MLEVKNINKKYRSHEILQNVSMYIARGEMVGLVGQNGAGKSTFLQIVATAMSVNSGDLKLNGLSYKDNLKAVRRQIGYVPQEVALWEHMTVRENMLFFAKLSWNKLSDEQCRAICENMQLHEWDKQVSALSGGMKRKLNIALSLIDDPQLLILDEPTVGIDLKSKTEIVRFLMQQAKEHQKMILYTSHDMEEITTYCDRVYMMGDDSFYDDYLQRKGISLEKI
ncbi:ABC transporter ATP-binding protein [Solibacillus sp. MA9]|uniref:ABC transporter ATP-binding protein n=1 Tax=Solibacillus palustris TaxID=2908203 RepID=A0ABS9UCG3_9BACL|nr:ABC transporter ATP-binding protein [Solibacillus sp. MA9]MCH7322027.1 ABC transporter ATP-binding protein [Solibacillus sp. MA9]